MKTLAVLALAFVCASCTTNTPTTAKNTSASRTSGEKRVYSGEQLKNTGHTSVGRQLESLDPSISARGPGE